MRLLTMPSSLRFSHSASRRSGSMKALRREDSRAWRAVEECQQAPLTRHERPITEVATIEVQEVEGPQPQLIWFGLAGEQAIEIRQPEIAACDKLSVDDCFARPQHLRGRRDHRVMLRKVVAILAQECDARVDFVELRAKAIELHFVNPPWDERRPFAAMGSSWGKEGERTHREHLSQP